MSIIGTTRDESNRLVIKREWESSVISPEMKRVYQAWFDEGMMFNAFNPPCSRVTANRGDTWAEPFSTSWRTLDLRHKTNEHLHRMRPDDSHTANTQEFVEFIWQYYYPWGRKWYWCRYCGEVRVLQRESLWSHRRTHKHRQAVRIIAHTAWAGFPGLIPDLQEYVLDFVVPRRKRKYAEISVIE